MEKEIIKGIAEALIYASGEPMSADRIGKITGANKDDVTAALEELREDYNQPDRGLQLMRIAEGYQIGTRLEYSAHIRKLRELPSSGRLSQAALETLAIIAYKQPVIKAEIEAIRGVDVSGVLYTLLEKRLIRILGRKKVPGTPFVYGTTKAFLKCFGLNSIQDLPKAEELKELFGTGKTKEDAQEPVEEDTGDDEPIELRGDEEGYAEADAETKEGTGEPVDLETLDNELADLKPAKLPDNVIPLPHRPTDENGKDENA